MSARMVWTGKEWITERQAASLESAHRQREMHRVASLEYRNRHKKELNRKARDKAAERRAK